MQLRFVLLAGLLPCAASCTFLNVDTRKRLDVFDTVRDAIAEDYPFLGRKALDWQELAKQYRSAVGLTKRPADFYHLLAGLLAELDDRHVSLEIPAENWLDHGAAPQRLDERAGFRIAFIEGRVHVTDWPDGEAPIPPDHLSASAASIPELVEIDRYQAVPSLLDVHFRGQASSPAALTLRWRDGTLSRHVLKRPAQPLAKLHERRESPRNANRVDTRMAHFAHDLAVPSDDRGGAQANDRPPLFELIPQRGFSLLRVRSFAPGDRMTREQFLQGIESKIDEAISRDEPLVIDLRGNGGGLLGLALTVARRFLPETQSIAFDEPDRSWFLGLFTVETLVSQQLEPLEPVFERPVAVLIDALTASAAELLARALQDGANAKLIGERTAGLGASRKEVSLPDGSTLRFGAGDILDARGNTLQDRGVLPDVPVRRTTSRFAQLGWRRAQREWNQRCFAAAREALRR